MTRRPARAGNVRLAAILLVATVSACRHRKNTPPFDAFEMKLDAPSIPGKPFPAVPDAVLGPARIWINQETPRQRKTPVWQPFPAKEGTLLDLNPSGNWRCLLNPLHVLGAMDEDSSVGRWTASRALRCSSDGWKTFVEGLVSVAYGGDGHRLDGDPRAVLDLKDVVDGQPRSTVVALDAAVTKAR